MVRSTFFYNLFFVGLFSVLMGVVPNKVQAQYGHIGNMGLDMKTVSAKENEKKNPIFFSFLLMIWAGRILKAMIARSMIPLIWINWHPRVCDLRTLMQPGRCVALRVRVSWHGSIRRA